MTDTGPASGVVHRPTGPADEDRPDPPTPVAAPATARGGTVPEGLARFRPVRWWRDPTPLLPAAAQAARAASSATASTSSRIASPSSASSSVVVHGGTTCTRLKFANSSSPAARAAAITPVIAADVPP